MPLAHWTHILHRAGSMWLSRETSLPTYGRRGDAHARSPTRARGRATARENHTSKTCHPPEEMYILAKGIWGACDFRPPIRAVPTGLGASMGKGSCSARRTASLGVFVAGLLLALTLPTVALAANTATF